MFSKLMIMAAAILAIGPVALADDDDDRPHAHVSVQDADDGVSVSTHEVRVSSHAIVDGECCEVEVEADECCEPVDVSYNHTKPAAAFRLKHEEGFFDDCR